MKSGEKCLKVMKSDEKWGKVDEKWRKVAKSWRKVGKIGEKWGKVEISGEYIYSGEKW